MHGLAKLPINKLRVVHLPSLRIIVPSIYTIIIIMLYKKSWQNRMCGQSLVPYQ